MIWRVSHCVFPYLYRQLRAPSLWPSCYCGIGDSPAHCNNIRIHFCLHTHKRANPGSTHAHLGGCSCLLDWVHFLGGAVAATRATNSCVPHIFLLHPRILNTANRFQSDQIVNSGLPCAAGSVACSSNVDGSELFGFHMGTCGIPIPPAHPPRRLHLAEPSRDERTVWGDLSLLAICSQIE